MDDLKKKGLKLLVGEKARMVLYGLKDNNLRLVDVARVFKMSDPLASFHVRKLVDCGLVTRTYNRNGSLKDLSITGKGEEFITYLTEGEDGKKEN